MRILLAGCTGFIGKRLVQELIHQEHEVVLLTRTPSKVSPLKNLTALQWDGVTLQPWSEKATKVDAIINLAGEGIADMRWSASRKKDLLESRILSTRALIQFAKYQQQKPSVFINASAVGFYGNVPDGTVSEKTPKGIGFLADTCAAWEKEAREAEKLQIRTVLLRIGIVLEKGGGALSKMLFPFQIFAGGPLGTGKQWFPWIHREDIIQSILFCLQNNSLSGPVNLTAPEPVTMKDFCSALGRALHRPSWAPVPGFMLKILLGEMSEMLLGGQRAIPEKLVNHGYSFRYPKLDIALKNILD